MQDELKSIQRKIGTTFAHVTHDQEEAMAIADRTAVMNNGRIEDVGSPEEIYRGPKTLFSATFIDEANVLPPRSGALMNHARSAELPLNAMPCVRPEDAGLSGELELGLCRLESLAFFGSHCRCQFRRLATEDSVILARLPLDAQLEEGAEVDCLRQTRLCWRRSVEPRPPKRLVPRPKRV